MQKIFALIAVRSASVRVKNKNMREFNNRKQNDKLRV